MSPKNISKLKDLHNAWRPYYSLIAIVLTFCGLSWEISHAAYSVISSDTKELHEATTINKQQNIDIAELKNNMRVDGDYLKQENQRRDEKIQQNALDINTLLTENK